MKIDANRPVGAGAIRKDAKTGKSSDFADNLSVQSQESPAPAAAASSVASIDALFALQEVPDATQERKRQLKRGDKMLERLEDLRRGLLLGTISQDKLTELAHLAREGSRSVDDPRLREVLEEIELRAEVELAKLSPSS
jgi:hypothetical protein